MPTNAQYGTPGEANKTIGGVPTLHYLDFASKGRGQVVRLLFEDAGIAYEDVRYSFEELPAAQKTTLKEMNPVGTVPIIELNGEILTQSYALLRHFSRILNRYDGKTGDEKYWVDAMCDLGADCKRNHLLLRCRYAHTNDSKGRNLFVAALFNPDKSAYAKHQKTDQIRLLDAVEAQLKGNKLSTQGPFVLGDTFTYADMVIYQMCHDEGLTSENQRGLGNHPRLSKLIEAVESRPNVKAFLGSDRYKG